MLFRAKYYAIFNKEENQIWEEEEKKNSFFRIQTLRTYTGQTFTVV